MAAADIKGFSKRRGTFSSALSWEARFNQLIHLAIWLFLPTPKFMSTSCVCTSLKGDNLPKEEEIYFLIVYENLFFMLIIYLCSYVLNAILFPFSLALMFFFLFLRFLFYIGR